ncbi:disulfide formation protein C 2 [Bacillus cereus]|nr:disulfide formation protein C 2 [Bacillus cereus]
MSIIRKYHIAIAWMIATSAMLISLVFEWMKFPNVLGRVCHRLFL